MSEEQQAACVLLIKETKLDPKFIQDICSEGGSPVLCLLQDALEQWDHGNLEKVKPIADTITDLAWEQLHIGHWKNVAVVWRDLYSYGCLLQAVCHVSQNAAQSAIKSLDMALLMGGPILEDTIKNFITKIHSWSNNIETTPTSEELRPGKRAHESIDDDSSSKIPKIEMPLISPDHEIERVEAPSMQAFYRDYMKSQTPVIVTHAMDYWPALTTRKWDANYLKKVAGLRTVPVEVGKTYLDDEWGQKLMTLCEFIDDFVNNPNATQTGYLAQTQLFDQIPELRKDIETPAYCSLDADNDVFVVNAWFGPKGTVTPAHYDPHHNLLAQVVGCKYLKLFPENSSQCLYPHSEKMLFNTSQVDVDLPDLQRFPEYSRAPYWECILQPGEMLYIPPKFWHFVKSLSTSFSVSFWWS